MGNFKVQFENIVDNRVNDLLLKTQKAFRLSRKLAPTNLSEYSYLLQSITEARASLAGDLIFDHVTFYIDFDGNNGSSLTDSKIPQTFKQVKDNTKNTIANLLKDSTASRLSRQEILQLLALFGEEGLSVTFDYVYINVGLTPRIVKQSIVGLNGTQKTILGLDDYTIEFSGKTIASMKRAYDVDTMRRFNALVKLGRPLKVSSIYLNKIWSINEVVIESSTFNQSTELGQGNMTDFQISAVSNTPLQLIEGTNIKI